VFTFFLHCDYGNPEKQIARRQEKKMVVLSWIKARCTKNFRISIDGIYFKKITLPGSILFSCSSKLPAIGLIISGGWWRVFAFSFYGGHIASYHGWCNHGIHYEGTNEKLILLMEHFTKG